MPSPPKVFVISIPASNCRRDDSGIRSVSYPQRSKEDLHWNFVASLGNLRDKCLSFLDNTRYIAFSYSQTATLDEIVLKFSSLALF